MAHRHNDRCRNLEHCEQCGKPLTGNYGMARMNAHTGRLYADGHDAGWTESEDQGWFPVGSDCLRRIKAAGDAGMAYRA